jgi:hypothetical protein
MKILRSLHAIGIAPFLKIIAYNWGALFSRQDMFILEDSLTRDVKGAYNQSWPLSRLDLSKRATISF